MNTPQDVPQKKRQPLMNPQQLLCFNVQCFNVRLTWVVGFNVEMKYEVLIQYIVNDVDGQLYFVLLRFKNRG